jgi:hypothetical protein
MAGIKRRQRTISSKPDGPEDPRAVVTITRLIHDLYASNGSCAAVSSGRDHELIKWSEVIRAVRGR